MDYCVEGIGWPLQSGFSQLPIPEGMWTWALSPDGHRVQMSPDSRAPGPKRAQVKNSHGNVGPDPINWAPVGRFADLLRWVRLGWGISCGRPAVTSGPVGLGPI